MLTLSKREFRELERKGIAMEKVISGKFVPFIRTKKGWAEVIIK